MDSELSMAVQALMLVARRAANLAAMNVITTAQFNTWSDAAFQASASLCESTKPLADVERLSDLLSSYYGKREVA